MADALLDTTVFIDYYRGHDGARRLVDRLLQADYAASYSPVTVFELWVRPMRREEESQYVALFHLFNEAPITAQIAQLAANRLKGRSRMARLRSFGDALIAATAAERAETIYTRNVKDFQRFYADVRSY